MAESSSTGCQQQVPGFAARAVPVLGQRGQVDLVGRRRDRPGRAADPGPLDLRGEDIPDPHAGRPADMQLAHGDALRRGPGGRLGQTRVLITGGLTACAGMLLACLAPDVWLALAGFAATGLGLANMFAAAIARAGLLAGSGGVALTSMLGYTGFLLGPPAIGFLASRTGLRPA
jgi:MFS family permease